MDVYVLHHQRNDPGIWVELDGIETAIEVFGTAEGAIHRAEYLTGPGYQPSAYDEGDERYSMIEAGDDVPKVVNITGFWDKRILWQATWATGTTTVFRREVQA